MARLKSIVQTVSALERRLYPLHSVANLLCFAALILLAMPISSFGQMSSEYEVAPGLSAAKVLPKRLLRAPEYSIEDRVLNDGYFNTYSIRTKWGVFKATGRPLLEIRIKEIEAIAQLDKLESSKVFLDAAKASGKNLVLAPIRAAEKVFNTISDPDKMLEVAKSVPEGAVKLFSWASRQVEGVYEGARDLVSSDKKEGGSDKKGEGLSTSDALKKGKDLGLSFIGYNKREREWFRKLNVSPYTSNQLLKDEIMRVASIETAVGTAFRFVPSVALLSELNTFNSWYGRAEKLALWEEPEAIRNKTKADLLSVGVTEEVITKFLAHPSYTPWSHRLISSSLAAIGASVKGHENFVRAACEANDEATALFFVAVADQLAETHQKRKIDRIVSSLYLPAAVLKDGTLFLPLQVDYLVWTKDVAAIFSDFKKRVVFPERCKRAEVYVIGNLSPRARQELSALGVVISVEG